ncbi:glycine betaine ABC transporter ATP-binding protein, partial [Streptomyces sp. SID10244]|nr:glycine betaine ABC transporter ATP-binding protein [Streptomyces sp. SID10244]
MSEAAQQGTHPNDIALRAEHVYKIFGRRENEVVKRLRAGADPDDLKEMGTAAVIDASFEVASGEI